MNQLTVLKELSDIKKNIYSLCERSGCSHYKHCKKINTVCSSDDYSPFRQVIKNNGGLFDSYFKIRTSLMEYNYPLVISQASAIGGYSTDDLCQEGMLGLCEAIDRFDFSFNNQFSTYAFYYIRKHILNFIQSNKNVKIATRIAHLTKVTEAAFDRIVQRRKCSPSKITTTQLRKEVIKLRREKKMGKMAIRESELSGHLERLQMQLIVVENLNPIDRDINSYDVQEQEDSFYTLLIKILDEELNDYPLWITEIVKLRFGVGPYKTQTSINEIKALLNLDDKKIEETIISFLKGDFNESCAS